MQGVTMKGAIKSVVKGCNGRQMTERAVLTRVFVAGDWLRVGVSNPLRNRVHSLLIDRKGQAKTCMLIEHLCLPTCIHRVNKRCKDQGQREYYGYWA
jgi:hypothetical protein